MSCTATGIPAPNGTLAVTELGCVVQHKGAHDLLGYVVDVILGYEDNSGMSSGEGVAATCNALGMTMSADAADLGFWSLGFPGAHMSAVIMGETAVPGLYNAKGWTVEGRDLFAELDWDRSGLAGTAKKGFFQLYHRPE